MGLEHTHLLQVSELVHELVYVGLGDLHIVHIVLLFHSLAIQEHLHDLNGFGSLAGGVVQNGAGHLAGLYLG